MSTDVARSADSIRSVKGSLDRKSRDSPVADPPPDRDAPEKAETSWLAVGEQPGKPI
jgi:hypothetical protein